MSSYITESILVNSDLETVYQTYYDVNEWKNALSDVLEIENYKCYENIQDFQMIVKKYGNIEKVHTIRRCFENSSIQLEQPVPPPQVNYMRGQWRFEEVAGAGTMITGIREFEVRTSIDKNKYVEKLRKSLRTNLLHFKNYIERTGIIEVVEHIEAPIEDIKQLFWNIEKWNQIWNPIMKTKCSYDNEFIQTFTMEVERNNIIEFIEGVQFLKAQSIDFYNTKCPPKLAVHCGQWIFEKENGGTYITAKRIFQMDESHIEEFVEYKNALRDRLSSILACFKVYFESKEGRGTY